MSATSWPETSGANDERVCFGVETSPRRPTTPEFNPAIGGLGRSRTEHYLCDDLRSGERAETYSQREDRPALFPATGWRRSWDSSARGRQRAPCPVSVATLRAPFRIPAPSPGPKGGRGQGSPLLRPKVLDGVFQVLATRHKGRIFPGEEVAKTFASATST